jgi:hypothetical protein
MIESITLHLLYKMKKAFLFLIFTFIFVWSARSRDCQTYTGTYSYECTIDDGGVLKKFYWNGGASGQWGITGCYMIENHSTGIKTKGYGGNSSSLQKECMRLA